MDIEALREYCLSKAETTEGFPFDDSTLVFKVAGKMFALISLQKWEIGKKNINLKCDPEKAISLREKYTAIFPGYHMSKKHWNTVDVSDAEISDDFLKTLIDHSYDCVISSFSQKKRLELGLSSKSKL